ncbi:hypothetical protein F5B20DRAFT_525678 [Whalleya microplaca]|nr:hypothetical protein F5B20DRAFT_525678 [Whalleya microplaca]
MATSTSGTGSSQVSSMSTQPLAPAITLPPQTTPYIVPSNPEVCHLSVYCKQVSQVLYTSIDTLLSGQVCQAVHGMTAPNGALTGVGHITSCYPDGYFSVFDDLYDELWYAPTEPYEGASSTLAYPGTACMSDWTTACTTTVTHEGSLFTQAWCCPHGSWQCTDRQRDRQSGFLGRHCISRLTESTPIWITWDPPYSGSGDDEYYTWTVIATSTAYEHAASVYHKVFPLQWTANTDTSTQPTTMPPNDPLPIIGSGGLSKGSIAGIAVSVVVFVLGVLGALFFFYRRRKRATATKPEPGVPPNLPGFNSENAAESSGYGKPELEGTSVPQAREVILKAELDARDSERQRPMSELPAEGSQQGTISPLGTLSPNPTVSDGTFPSPESRQKSVFELQG